MKAWYTFGEIIELCLYQCQFFSFFSMLNRKSNFKKLTPQFGEKIRQAHTSRQNQVARVPLNELIIVNISTPPTKINSGPLQGLYVSIDVLHIS